MLREEGFDTIPDLQLINVDELRSIGFKLGHAKKLVLALEKCSAGGATLPEPPVANVTTLTSALRPPPPTPQTTSSPSTTPTLPLLPPTRGAGVNAAGQEVTHCATCGDKINGNAVSAIDRLFHPECFACNRCGCSLEGVGFKAEAGLPFCSLCWHTEHGVKCVKCERPVLPDATTGTIPYVTVNDQPYHKHCWACDVCGEQFGDGPTGGAYVVGSARMCHRCAHNQ
jgi:hypothetical protein